MAFLCRRRAENHSGEFLIIPSTLKLPTYTHCCNISDLVYLFDIMLSNWKSVEIICIGIIVIIYFENGDELHKVRLMEIIKYLSIYVQKMNKNLSNESKHSLCEYLNKILTYCNLRNKTTLNISI